MAEESEKNDKTSENGFDQSKVENHFSNNSYVQFTRSDVSIIFTHEYGSGEYKVVADGVRVTFSHAGFIEMFNFLQSHVDFLKKSYSGHPITLDDVDSEVLSQALKELHDNNEGTQDSDISKDNSNG